MDNEEFSIITSLKDNLLKDSFDLSQDYIEMALDEFIAQDLIREVPVVGTLYKMGKVGLSLQHYRMAKNYYVFLANLRCNEITDDLLKQHIHQLENSPKKLKNELEMLLVYIDKYMDAKKAEYMANVYRAYLNNSSSGIDWNQAVRFFEILDRLFLVDIECLKKVSEKGAQSDDFSDHSGLLRLSALGLVQYFNGKEEAYGHNKSALAKVTNEGKAFYRIITTGKLF